jgi:hypothetical protein
MNVLGMDDRGCLCKGPTRVVDSAKYVQVPKVLVSHTIIIIGAQLGLEVIRRSRMLAQVDHWHNRSNIDGPNTTAAVPSM